jgi:hypothetical protein
MTSREGSMASTVLTFGGDDKMIFPQSLTAMHTHHRLETQAKSYKLK